MAKLGTTVVPARLARLPAKPPKISRFATSSASLFSTITLSLHGYIFCRSHPFLLLSSTPLFFSPAQRFLASGTLFPAFNSTVHFWLQLPSFNNDTHCSLPVLHTANSLPVFLFLKYDTQQSSSCMPLSTSPLPLSALHCSPFRSRWPKGHRQ